MRIEPIPWDTLHDNTWKEDWVWRWEAIFTITQKSIKEIMLSVKHKTSYEIVDFMRLFFVISRDELTSIIDPNNLVAQKNINDAFNLFYDRIDENWSKIMRKRTNAPRKRMPTWWLYEDVYDWLRLYQKYIFIQSGWKITDNLPRSSKFGLEKPHQLSEALKYIRENWSSFRDCLVEVTDPYYGEEVGV